MSAAMSAMRRGKKRRPLTPEHRAKISEGRRRTIAARHLAKLAPPTMADTIAAPLDLQPIIAVIGE